MKRGDYWWGNRVQQLNAAGTKAALALGWRVYRTYDRKVDIRDSIHPTDAVLVETFQTLTGHREKDQANHVYFAARRTKPDAPCDKLLANYSVRHCRSGPGQLASTCRGSRSSPAATSLHASKLWVLLPVGIAWTYAPMCGVQPTIF